MEKIKGSEIKKCAPYYENVVVYYDGDKAFYLSFNDLTDILKTVDFSIEKKRTRVWGTPNIKK